MTTKENSDKFVVDPEGIQEEGYLGKDGKIHKDLPESERADFSHLYDSQGEADNTDK